MDLSIIINFFSNEEVMSFIATYVAEKAMDGIIKYVSKKFGKDSLEYELIEALEDSLKEMCQHYNWEYDSTAIVETFMVSLNTIEHIDSESLLKDILQNAIGQLIDDNILKYWIFAFHKQVTKPKRNWLRNYIIVNHLYNGSQTLDVIERKVIEENRVENKVKFYINEIKNNYSVDIFQITTEYIEDRRLDSNRLQERFYRVSSNFDVLFEAVINQWDVTFTEATDYIEKNIDIVDGGILITGNGGMGKTTCMLHVAVKMALQHKTVIWINLENSQQYIKNNPRFIKNIFEEMVVVVDKKIYLFIENPFANFQLTQTILELDNRLIGIIISERISRFEQIFFNDLKANIQYWLEKSNIVCIGNCNEALYDWINVLNVFKIDVIKLYMDKIINNFKHFFADYGFNKDLLDRAVNYAKENNNDDISIVEQIYIILNYYIHNSNTNIIIKNEVKLDWEEWESLIGQYTGKNEKYTFSIFAIIYLFKISLDIPTVAKIYNKSETQISNLAMNIFHDGVTEPLIYKNGMFMLRHDMVAELYFQLNKKMDPLQVLENAIPYLSTQLLEKFCIIVFNKKTILNNFIFNGFFSATDIIKKLEKKNELLEIFEKNDCLIYFELAKYFASIKVKDDIERTNNLNFLIKKYKGRRGENVLLFEQKKYMKRYYIMILIMTVRYNLVIYILRWAI